jgi:cyclin T
MRKTTRFKHSEGQDRWYFSKEELQRTPSVLSGIDVSKELSYRQQSANLIQDMGQRLLVYPSF